jgi:protein-L-isoaspartate(D-aspartate) O-methyltransferase
MAYDDVPLPIGFGQTISQPYTVVFMLELLDIKRNEKIADIGSGSGWLSAILACLVGENGHVYAFEVIEDLCMFGKKNLERYPNLGKRISFHCENAIKGIENIDDILFDRIIISADIREIPRQWREKLATGGIVVYSSRGSIFKEVKKSNGVFEKFEFPGFVFVPFV